jgi:hypothetical protein
LLADAAMLVVPSVPFTLLATRLTGDRTGLNRRAEHRDIERCLAGGDAACGAARVGAIQIAANAMDQVLHTRLAETSVGAAGAFSRAVEARVDAAQERVAINARRAWMRLEHLLNRHFGLLLSPPTG